MIKLKADADGFEVTANGKMGTAVWRFDRVKPDVHLPDSVIAVPSNIYVMYRADRKPTPRTHQYVDAPDFAAFFEENAELFEREVG